jgi:hypothetical protein
MRLRNALVARPRGPEFVRKRLNSRSPGPSPDTGPVRRAKGSPSHAAAVHTPLAQDGRGVPLRAEPRAHGAMPHNRSLRLGPSRHRRRWCIRGRFSSTWRRASLSDGSRRSGVAPRSTARNDCAASLVAERSGVPTGDGGDAGLGRAEGHGSSVSNKHAACFGVYLTRRANLHRTTRRWTG